MIKFVLLKNLFVQIIFKKGFSIIVLFCLFFVSSNAQRNEKTIFLKKYWKSDSNVVLIECHTFLSDSEETYEWISFEIFNDSILRIIQYQDSTNKKIELKPKKCNVKGDLIQFEEYAKSQKWNCSAGWTGITCSIKLRVNNEITNFCYEKLKWDGYTELIKKILE